MNMQEGLDVANDQLEYYCIAFRRNGSGFTELQGEIGWQHFVQNAYPLVENSLKKAMETDDGHLVARGIAIENCFYDAKRHALSNLPYSDRYFTKALLVIEQIHDPNPNARCSVEAHC